MAVNIGANAIANAFIGDTAVSAMFLGSEQVYPMGTGDIRLRIATTESNQQFDFFSAVETNEGGYVYVDWGDGKKELLKGSTIYKPTHTYATAGEYTVKMTGSKFVRIGDWSQSSYFKTSLRGIVSQIMPKDCVSVAMRRTYQHCTGLTGSIPEWDEKIKIAEETYYNCTGLTGSIPPWNEKITYAAYAYYKCTGLTGSVPAWNEKITDADCTYSYCKGLTGSVPAWNAVTTTAHATFLHCSGLTGIIPAWGKSLKSDVNSVYGNCTGLAGCSSELIEDPMPTRITFHGSAVSGCVDNIRKYFYKSWGGNRDLAMSNLLKNITSSSFSYTKGSFSYEYNVACTIASSFSFSQLNVDDMNGDLNERLRITVTGSDGTVYGNNSNRVLSLSSGNVKIVFLAGLYSATGNPTPTKVNISYLDDDGETILASASIS